MQKRKVYFISGAPTTGKTTLAKELSKKFAIPWISTDTIKKWMIQICNKENYPNLFLETEHTAETFWKTYSIKEAVEEEKAGDKEVFKGIKAFLQENTHWDSFILEGISLHPHMIEELSRIKDIEFKIIFLVETDKKRIKETIYTRGLWGKAETYENWVKELEIDYVIAFNKYYEKEALKYKQKIIKIKEREKVLEEALEFFALF
jgi:2-phosphoglycerate kinase